MKRPRAVGVKVDTFPCADRRSGLSHAPGVSSQVTSALVGVIPPLSTRVFGMTEKRYAIPMAPRCQGVTGVPGNVDNSASRVDKWWVLGTRSPDLSTKCVRTLCMDVTHPGMPMGIVTGAITVASGRVDRAGALSTPLLSSRGAVSGTCPHYPHPLLRIRFLYLN